MESASRPTGLEGVAQQPWGTHFCLFYETQADLVDLLIPYFKAGLENQEFCFCVASAPLIAEDVDRTLRKAVPGYPQYLAAGQIEIISHERWYLASGRFDPVRVRQGWIDKLQQARERGYAGMRFAANASWVPIPDWAGFADYEAKLDGTFAKLPILALCAYSLMRCSSADMLDVVRHHQFTLARRQGAWERLEGPELQSAHAQLNADLERRVAERTAQLAEANAQLQSILATLPVGVIVTNTEGDIVLSNAMAEQIWGGIVLSGRERWAESRGFWHDSGKPIEPESWPSVRALRKGQTAFNQLIDIETFDGQKKTIQSSTAPIRNAEGAIQGAVVVTQDVTARVRGQEALQEAKDRLQQLSRRLLAVQEEDRRHVARELHDEFGQLLASVTLHLHALKSVATGDAQPRLEECLALLQRAGEEVRSLALELRPTMLETAGLDATLQWLAQQHEQRTGVATRVVGHVDGASGELAIACFRIVQEALTNVALHAAAKRVSIELSRSQSDLELVIRDDGVGFDAASALKRAAQDGRLGLLGMRERVQILGGELQIDSKPGQGTRIRVRIPLETPGTEPPDGPDAEPGQSRE